MKPSRFLYLIAFFATVLFPVDRVRSAPSLASGHQKTYDLSETRQVTVIMDHRNPLQWFYMPEGLVLGRNQEGEPEFQLLRYEFEGNTADAELVRGGIMQFSAAYSQVRGPALNRLKEFIAADLNAMKSIDPEVAELLDGKVVTGRDINVGNIPFTSVQVGMYAPGSAEGPGQLVTQTSLSDDGPKFGSQSMPFTLELSDIGTEVYDALTSGPTGIQVLYKVKYMGAAEKQGFSIDVDFREAHKHFSSQVKQRTSVAANVMGVDLEAAVGSDTQNIFNELKQSGAIKVKIEPGAQVDETQIFKYMDPILEKIYAEVFAESPFKVVSLDQSAAAKNTSKEDATIAGARREQPKGSGATSATENTEGAEAEDPDGGGGDPLISTGLEDENIVPNVIPVVRTEINIATKSIEQVSEKIYSVDFNFRPIIEESTVVAGFLGLPSDADRDRHVQMVTGSSFGETVLVLPTIANSSAEALGVSTIDLEVFLAGPDGSPVDGPGGVQRSVNYRFGEGWSVKGQALQFPRLTFSVTDYMNRPDRDRLNFLVSAKISRSKPGVPPTVMRYPISFRRGVVSLDSPLGQFATVQVDLSTMPLWEYDAAMVFFTPKGGRRTPPVRVDTATYDYFPISFLVTPEDDGSVPVYDVSLQMVKQRIQPFRMEWKDQNSPYLVLENPAPAQ